MSDQWQRLTVDRTVVKTPYVPPGIRASRLKPYSFSKFGYKQLFTHVEDDELCPQ